MTNQKLPSFDELLTMAQQQPEEFEKLKAQLAQQTINHAPKHLRPRLMGLQFEIDSTLRAAKTPVLACIKLSNMMHQSLHRLGDLLTQEPCRETSKQTPAKVIPFTRH